MREKWRTKETPLARRGVCHCRVQAPNGVVRRRGRANPSTTSPRTAHAPYPAVVPPAGWGVGGSFPKGGRRSGGVAANSVEAPPREEELALILWRGRGNGGTTVRVTRHWLEAQGNHGALTRDQLAALGVGWPPPKGWKLGLLGTEIPAESAATVERLTRANADRRIAEAERKRVYDESAAGKIFYTMPDGRGGWVGSWEKPAGFGEDCYAEEEPPWNSAPISPSL